MVTRIKKNPTKTDEIIRFNIIRLMEERGWKKVDLEREYGCTQPAMSQWLSGTRGFGLQSQTKFAKVFEITVLELITMPPGYTSKEVEDSWNEFVALKMSRRGGTLEMLVQVLKYGPDDAVESLEGLVKILEKNIKVDIPTDKPPPE